jgi:DNA-binding NarL/FixJ family response regulator
MVNALRLVFGGGIYIPPEALGRSERKEQEPVTERHVSPAELASRNAKWKCWRS